jgi:hypothetical protein
MKTNGRMKPEPLKDKWEKETLRIRVDKLFLQDIKLAVEWLLKEVEKEEEKFADLETHYDVGYLDACEKIKNLIKQAFEDVV